MLAEIVYRRISALRSLGFGQNPARGTSLDAIAVSQTEPPGFDRARAGYSFETGFTSSVVGIAPTQQIPTTAAQWLLYNGGTRFAVIDEIGVVLVSGTAAAGVVLLGSLGGPGRLPATVPTANATGIAIKSRSDGAINSSKSSSLVLASSQTLASAPAGWTVYAKSDSANTSALSVAAMNTDIKGNIIIRPGQGLALNVTSGTGTSPLFVPQIVWSEFDADVE